ncbi:MAG: trigger factor [Bacteroidales bacterium]|nr:trigger factor [Bacteroidales bacterium]
MNIEQKQSDALSATIGLTIEPTNYADRVKKSLNEFRRNAEIKGFRKGMVPMGLIQKMHGRTALLEEVNKLMSEGVNQYINDNKIKIIGEPLPNDELQESIDWDRAESFTFVFDLMLAPKVELSFTADDHIPLKEPEITQADKDEYLASLCKQHGQLTDLEEAEGEDFLKVDMNQGGKTINDAYISLKTIAKKSLKKPFIGVKVGDTVEIDIVKTFPNDTDRAALLKVKKEELDNDNPLWQLTVLEIKRFAPATLNQELFDRVLGPGQADSPEAFTDKVEERMRREFEAERDYRFMLDARAYAISKSAIALPDALLKRWLHYSNDGKFSMEEIERDYEDFARDFRWQLVREYLMQENNIQITKEDLMHHAYQVAQYQFAMYGLHSVPAEHLEKYAKSLLDNEKEYRRIFEKVEDDKVIALIRTQVSVDIDKVPFSQIRAMS